MMDLLKRTLGARYLGDGRCHFSVWAPYHAEVKLHLHDPIERLIELKQDEKGYFLIELEGIGPGSLYTYRLSDGRDLPDPSAIHQPHGVHGPSEVVDTRQFVWTDHDWRGLAWDDLVIYELHVGTFTPEGTLDAAIAQLPYLLELGITAIELMPIAQFPGERNWGYDGVYPFAVHSSYGGPLALQRLVDACHASGVAVLLDVVYNHLGPEGNYLHAYGPYFTDQYRGPWGAAINFDGEHSDEVRRFFIENAVHWVSDFHLDGLRLDAIHGIVDQSASPFLSEVTATVKQLGHHLQRPVMVIAESDGNDPRVVRSQAEHGYGMDGQWNDDFHHALHALISGERTGYYRDFGRLCQLGKAFREGFVYSGQYSPYRRRRHGAPLPPEQKGQLVVFAQNHDQIGNRAGGERLSHLVSGAQYRLAAATVLLSPFVPLLFMGEEYGEQSPFFYFTSHSDPDLVEAVRRGRACEFADFEWTEVADPQSETTFLQSRLRRTEHMEQTMSAQCLAYYRALLAWRKHLRSAGGTMEVVTAENNMWLGLHQKGGQAEFWVYLHFCPEPASMQLPRGSWCKRLDSSEASWPSPSDQANSPVTQRQQPVKGWSCVVYEKWEG